MIEMAVPALTMREMVEQEFSDEMVKHICPHYAPGVKGTGNTPCTTENAECGSCCIERVTEFINDAADSSVHCDNCKSACSGIMHGLKMRGLL